MRNRNALKSPLFPRSSFQQVKPEQYDILEKFLMEAMKDVLGGAATDEVGHFKMTFSSHLMIFFF